MSFVDNLISAISPRWAAQRHAWRMIENSYKGGVPTRTSESWSASQPMRFDTQATRTQLLNARDRAYKAYKNNPVARSLVQTETDNVIGDGLNYQPTSDDEAWNREAEEKYYSWLEECSVRGPDIHTGCELQRMLWDQSRVAGDIGWILVSRGSDSFIQVVRSENIVTPDGMYQDPAVYEGIRWDAWGKPITYYVLSQSERNAQRTFIPVPARDFVYLSHMSDSNMARGETCFITIFDLLAHLDRYVDGVSLAAWMATVIGIIFKQKNPAKAMSVLGTLANSQGEQQKAITFENGMFKYVGTDEDVAQVQAHQPMTQTPEFIRAMFRMLGQPFDMPLEVIAKDMSTCTFASARIGLLPFYRSCRIKAYRFGSRWSRTIRWWLSRERLRPDGDRNKWKTAFPENYWNHELLANEWDYTDPVSEVQGDLLQVDAGFKSEHMVLAEHGRNGRKIIEQRKEWKKETEAADLPQVHSTMTRDPAPEVEETEPTESSDNGNGNGEYANNRMK